MEKNRNDQSSHIVMNPQNDYPKQKPSDKNQDDENQQLQQQQNRYAHLITSQKPMTPRVVVVSRDDNQQEVLIEMTSVDKKTAAAGVTISSASARPTLKSLGESLATNTSATTNGAGTRRQRPAYASYYTSFSSFDLRQQWTLIKLGIMDRINEPQGQRRLILFIVCCALLLDNMLYMVIVPIIPDYLRSIGAWSTYAENGQWIRRNRTDHTGDVPKWERIGGQIIYEGEESAVGFLFASKAIVQLFVNPFSGHLIDRIGYEIPMMIGLSVMFSSTMVFACGQTYTILFLARSLQGVGSAFADTSGLAMIADRFTDGNERQRALGIALAFISFGCLVAPPFGSVLYQAAGKEVPFIVLSLICLVDGSLLMLVTPPGTFRQLLPGMYQQPAPPPPPPAIDSPTDDLEEGADGARSTKTATQKREAMRREMSVSRRQSMQAAGVSPRGTPIHVLLRDPYIACCAGALVVANVSLAFLEPTISIWVRNTMPDIEEWQLGMIWLPAFVPHVLGVYLTVKLADKYPRYHWLIAAIGLVLEGLSCLFIPFCSSFWSLMIPISVICFGLALIDTAILPTLGFLVDSRYVSVYGSIYAIADISYSLSYAVGPIIAGNIVEAIGFTALNVLIALVTLGYTPVLTMLTSIHDYGHLQAGGAQSSAEAAPFGRFGRAPISGEEGDEYDGEGNEMSGQLTSSGDPFAADRSTSAEASTAGFTTPLTCSSPYVSGQSPVYSNNYNNNNYYGDNADSENGTIDENSSLPKTRYNSPTWATKIKRKPAIKKSSSRPSSAGDGYKSANNNRRHHHHHHQTYGTDAQPKKLSFNIDNDAHGRVDGEHFRYYGVERELSREPVSEEE